MTTSDLQGIIFILAIYSAIMSCFCIWAKTGWEKTLDDWTNMSKRDTQHSAGLVRLLHGYKKDCKWYERNLHFIRLAAEDPNGTLEEIQQLADDALKHEGREDDTTTQ